MRVRNGGGLNGAPARAAGWGKCDKVGSVEWVGVEGVGDATA